MNDTLNREFESALIELYKKIIEDTDYKPTMLLQMIRNTNAVEAAKSLINSNKPSDGYTQLYFLERLDLTVEAFVFTNPKWHPLFTDAELNKAEQRLLAFKYIINQQP